MTFLYDLVWVSTMNPNQVNNRSCIKTGDSQTGSTWTGCVLYCRTHKPITVLFENVKGLMVKDESGRSQLDRCLSDLRALGYRAVALALCARRIGLPVNRARVYIVGSLELSFAELTSLVDSVAAMESRDADDTIPMSAFLLEESSPLITRGFEDRVAGKFANASSSSAAPVADFKWVLKTDQPFSDVSSQVTRSSSWMSPDAANKWVDILTDRERRCLTVTTNRTGVLNLSQDQDRGAVTDDGCPCVTPKGVYFSMDRARLLVAIEHCALQCMRFDPSVLDRFSWSFLHDLAGNGFNGGVMSVFIISLLITYARRHVQANPVVVPVPAPASDITSDAPPTFSDDDALLVEGLNAHDDFLGQCDDLLADALS